MSKENWIEILGIALLIWSNIIATLAYINEKKGKKKTAHKKPPKHKRKR